MIVSLFIINYSDTLDSQLRFGPTSIWVGDEPVEFSPNFTLAKNAYYHDGGFINLDYPVIKQYVALRRIDGDPSMPRDFYAVSSVRVYGMKNAVDSSVVLSSPQTSDDTTDAVYLL